MRGGTKERNNPPEKNKKAIYFAISDNYSFAVANVIMSLYKHSLPLVKTCDIIIYHNGICEKNKQLLQELHAATFFEEMTFPNSWNALLSHKMTVTWGSFIICKFFGFRLIHTYDQVLFMDADMHIIDDISELFDIEEEMAWRKVLAWKPQDNFATYLSSPDDFISAGNGGLYYFSKKLRKYNINDDSIVAAFEKAKTLTRGGNDERIMGLLVYENKISVKELDVKIWNTPIQRMTPDTKLLHFLDYVSESTKPWKNLAAYLYFKDWAENYQKWLMMGGEGLVHFSEDDYYKLFAFEKLKKLEKQQKKIKEKDAAVKELKVENKKLKNSRSWKLTKPFRAIMKALGTLKKKVKLCFKN